jgi:hypothetical protein
LILAWRPALNYHCAQSPAGGDLIGAIAMQRSGLLVIGSILLGGLNAAPAQAAPCALMCLTPTVLNAKTCTCEPAIVRKPVCSLVCLDPDQTLDAKKCACVRRPR